MVSVISILLFLEFFFGFVVYTWKYGKSYYSIRTGSSIFRYDPNTGYCFYPNLRYSNASAPLPKAPRRILYADVRTNKDSFIADRETETLPHPRLFCLGGSTTAGLECRFDKTYPAWLSQRLHDCNFTVINAGTGGYRSIHELLTFKHRILRHRPSAVIVFSGYNDFEDFALGLGRPFDPFAHAVSHLIPTGRWENLLSYSALFHVVKRIGYRLLGRIRTESAVGDSNSRLMAALDHPTWLHEWRQNIGEIITICKEQGIRCFLLSTVSPTYPNASKEAKAFADIDLNMDGRFDAFERYTRLINGEAESLASECGASYLDIVEEFDGRFRSDGGVDYVSRFRCFVDRMHFSEQGNDILAELTARKLKRHL